MPGPKTKLRSAFQAAVAGTLAAAFLLAGRPLADVSIDTTLAEAVNDDLRAEAKSQAEAVGEALKGPYARDVAETQARITGYLGRNPSPFVAQVIVIDPQKTDAMAAMGLTTRMATEAYLSQRGYGGLPYDDVSEINARLYAWTVSPGGTLGYGLSPATKIFSDTRLCVMVPALPYATLLDEKERVPGLSPSENIVFFNEHEGAHCTDAFYDGAVVSRFRSKILWEDLKSALDKPEILEAISVASRKESLADVTALGTMIRAGGPLGLIGHVAAWRTQGDLQHRSTPVLRQMETRIMDMGLAAFRTMPEAQAAQFYYETVESAGLSSAEAVKGFITRTQGTDRQRQEMEKAPSRPTANGIAMGEEVLEQRKWSIPALLHRQDDAQAAMTRRLEQWDADKALAQRAFRDAGRVTPDTLVNAATNLQAELRRGMEENPQDRLLPEQALKLRNTFILAVDNGDFVAVNRLYGVNIVPAPRL